jgi:tRNA(Ile)-lysidine synthetase, N-terminal domain
MAQARINRFNGLINFCLKNNILHLFLGHHFDDNLETYLMRKINGSNLEGLGSMNILLSMERIQIIRPLIETNKSSIINFNKKNKIKFINDPSNEDCSYTRVKIRNFLQNKNYKKLARLDFLKIKNQIPSYKKMIWELLIKNITKININKVEINFNRFIKSDNLIIEKHILILLKFFSNKNYQIKSQKIKFLLK